MAFSLATLLSGCSSGGATKVVSYQTPANVTLSPGPNASMDVGAVLTFTAQAEDNANNAVTQPITYFSSNPAVATIAATGAACAGTWDSISTPQVCTPGPAGVAQITASAQGVTSPPTTLYVHQHIDNISASTVTGQSNPGAPCVTAGQKVVYAAKAFSRGSDITATVGQFGWTSVNFAVVSLSTNSALPRNQTEATAGTPGVSSIFATLGNVVGVPLSFVTCPVQSIALSVNGNSSKSIVMAQGSSQTVTATVTDSLGNVITGVPLTWTSSNPTSVTAAVGAIAQNTAGTISAAAAGGASVTASCTPPTCNIGIQPSLPIYPASPIDVVVTPAPGATAVAATLYVTTSGCQGTAGCISTIVPVTLPANTVGTAVNLPATPDSIAFSRDGSNLYLGTDVGQLGTKGLMKFTPSATAPAVTQNTSVVGKVVSISPDGSKAVISDIADPNSSPQVFVFDTAANSATAIPLVAGSTSVAADFSPDSFKAFIVASNGSAATLYVYSKVDALQTIPLGAAANDVAFLPGGSFGYIADAISQLSIVPTCNNPPPSTPPVVTTSVATAAPSIIRPLIDRRMLTVAAPGLELFTPAVSGNGCAFPRPYPVTPDLNPANLVIPGDLTVSNTSSFFNLGQGNFIPRQLIISSDSSTAYILANDASGNPLGIILVFNILNHTTSAISLAGNAIPLQAAITPDGTTLYVGASDGTVHAVSTIAGGDFQEIAFPLGLCQNASGSPFATTCNPDLLALRP
ncbi:MAG: YncE family protein [Terriglobales bacterium]